MTWTAHHRRGAVLEQVVTTADTRLDGRLPLDVPGVAETFGSDLALIGVLQLKWHTRLAGRIERELLEEPEGSDATVYPSLEQAVLAAWRATHDEMPGIRAILDHYSAEPTSPEMARALDVANRKDWALMAALAGLASAQDGAAAEVGRRLEAKARAAQVQQVVVPQPRQESLLDRLKAVLAA